MWSVRCIENVFTRKLDHIVYIKDNCIFDMRALAATYLAKAPPSGKHRQHSVRSNRPHYHHTLLSGQ